jgi:nucleoid-associated protein YgaU
VAGARVILPRPHRRPSPGRRVGTALLTLGALGALWAGAGAVRGAGPASSPHRIAGSVAVVGGFRYVVQPGDSLWAIATRVDPGGDPRALVDALSAELHGQMLQPGDVLVVP